MSNKPVKSIEDLAKEVLDTQEGLKSVDDLKTLFETPRPQPAVAPAVPQQVAEPTPAPTAVAPTVTVPPTVEPPKGEPDVLGLVPEKFRDKDVQTAIGKFTKSYADLEAELKKEKDERANMQKIIDSLAAPKPSVTPSIPLPTEEAFDDAAVFEKPVEVITKIAEKIASQKVLQYHADNERAKYIENFRAQHKDFDQVRPEMMEVLAVRRDLDSDQRNLPIVYELAKQLKAKKIADLRASLGLAASQPVAQPTPTPAPVPEDREKLKEELLEAIRSELQKRKAASGIQGGSTPVNPTDRLQPAPTQKTLTPEEAILAEMLASGPKKLAIDLG